MKDFELTLKPLAIMAEQFLNAITAPPTLEYSKVISFPNFELP